MGAIMGNYSPMTTANSPPNSTAHNTADCSQKRMHKIGKMCNFCKKSGKFWAILLFY